MAMQRQLRLVAEAGAVEPALRVAFASSDLQRVDQHFGSAVGFVFHAVTPQSSRLLEAVQFGIEAQDGNEDKLVARIAALEGCAAVYCQAVGASAVRQLLAIGVQPMKVDHGTPITRLLGALESELREGPSAWLARAIDRDRKGDRSRFDAMEAEGWDE